MKRIVLILSAVLVCTAFIIPASKMADLLKADRHFKALVLQGNAYFNLGSDYINRPVPLRVVILPSGYSVQDYTFPKAQVRIIHEQKSQTILVNKVNLLTLPVIFSENTILSLLMSLYLSAAPQHIFADMGLDSMFTAYGLANDRAAYIIGNANDQLFIDNEDTVPIMFRVQYKNVSVSAVVKSYLDRAKLVEGRGKTRKQENGKAGIAALLSGNFTETAMTLPGTVELYNGSTMVQRWVFGDAYILTGETEIKQLVLTPFEIKKLSVSRQPVSPFMLF